MNRNRLICEVAGAALALTVCLMASNGAGQAAAAVPQQDSGLVIMNDARLPETHVQNYYEVRLTARGGAAPLHWRLEKGTLPAGLALDPNGLLRGVIRSGGEFQFTALVSDSSNQRARKDFSLLVKSGLELRWKSLAHVDGNRIDGSVEVSNSTPDEVDLTFVVLAVAANGRATAIGYQHFPLRSGTVGQELPFGDTLPRGGYVVHVDAVGEVISKKLIYREHLQTQPLQVSVGP